jgi:dipeptidyl aminopeptidase/acylaminoacyl peptidase
MTRLFLMGAMFTVLATFLTARATTESRSSEGVPVEVMLRSPYVPTSGSTSLSADGKLFAYTVCDVAKSGAARPADPRDPHRDFTNRGVPIPWVGCVIWITDTRTNEQHPVTSDDSNSWAPSWSADGTRLAFYSDRDGIARLWLWTASDKEFRRLSSEPVHPGSWQRPYWTPDSQYLLVPLIPASADFETAITHPADVVQRESKASWKYPGATVQIFSNQGHARATVTAPTAADASVVTDRPKRPWLSDLAYISASSGQVKRIGVTSGNDWYALSPDGRRVVVARKTATLAGEYRELFTVELLSVDGTRTELTSTLLGIVPNGSWSPDGHKIAVSINTSDQKSGASSTALYILSVTRGAPKVVSFSDDGFFDYAPPAWDAESRYIYLLGSKHAGENTLVRKNLIARVEAANGDRRFYPSDPYSPSFSGFLHADAMPKWDSFGKNRLVYAAINQNTQEGTFVAFDLSSGQVSPLWSAPKRFAALVADALGTEDTQVSADNHTLVTYLSSSDRPPNFYAFNDSLSESRQITTVDPEVSKHTYGKTELVTWNSSEGTPLAGIVVLPVNYVSGRKYPTIVYIYPDGDFSNLLNGFNADGIEQIFATRGYAVLLASATVRPDGGLLQSITHSVVPAAQKLIDMGIADPDRLGLMGGSFGGYSTAAVITQTSLFKAAVVICGDVDLISSYGELRDDGGTGGAWWATGQFKLHASLWEHPERYIENSPVFYLDKVTTPVLILHGVNDDRVPIGQGRELYANLSQLGKEVMFREYAHEGHSISNVFADRADTIYSQIDWFDHYLKRAEQEPRAQTGWPAIKSQHGSKGDLQGHQGAGH